MKAVILAGGLGTRISEESINKPKPMIKIGQYPILWHIMKIYSHYGINDFIICAGYKSQVIKNYFRNYYLNHSNVTFNLKDNTHFYTNPTSENWTITIIETGIKSNTGERLRLAKQYLDGDSDFLFTYGDGVSDVNIKKLIETHNTNNTVATVTAINTPSRFGVMDIDKTTNQIRSFHEKPSLNSVRVNGGFFVLSNPVFDYLEKHENSIFEKEPLEELVRNNELSAYCHNGFWHSMDTLRDKLHLDAIWEAGKAPWALWET